ncbi:SRPBCC family protein [Dactylosporangium sp. NPDC051485]|uniref:SRPBCC family protein n=1 Tax=Dactylosporangium sp. NPDC051485 TaxID=3154846 RepID=UPI00344AACE5
MFDAGPAAEVGYTATEDGRWTLRFVRDLRHPPQRVWRMLTEPGELARWAPFTADRDLGHPGPATLSMIDGETATPLPAEVRAAEAPRLLEYTWGDDLLRWELRAAGDATRLTLWHTMADRGMVSKIAAGWHQCVRVMELGLDGTPHPPVRGRDALHYGWADLEASYRTTLEP